MMRTLRLALTGTVALALVCGLGSSVLAQDPGEGDGNADSILFVGNSFTGYDGGVEKQVAGLAEAEDPPREITADASIIGGATLKMHYRLSELGVQDGPLDEIRAAGYDVVVLQGDIPEIIERDVAPFLEYARLFDEEIAGAGAETVFFMAWPYERAGWIDLEGIVAAHRQVESELGARVAPVGSAMDRALAERPDLPMPGQERAAT